MFRRLFHFRTGRFSVRREVDDEIAFHLQNTIDELIAAGHTPEQARDEAERRFGDVEAHRAASKRIAGRRHRTRRRGGATRR